MNNIFDSPAQFNFNIKTRTHNHLVRKRRLNPLAKLAKWLSWAVLCVLICTVDLTVWSCHVTYAFQSESTLSSCLNVKELFAQSRRKIWSLSYCSWTRTHNHLVHKRTLKHLAKLAKWLSCAENTYLYGAFDYMFSSCHVCVSDTATGFESSCSHLKNCLFLSFTFCP